MANQHIFFAGKMGSQQLDVLLANARVMEDDEPIAAPDGGLVVLGDLEQDMTYAATGDYQYDVYEAAKPAAATDEVALIDYAGVSEGEIAGNEYKIGVKLFGLDVPAGTLTRVRRPMLHDKFWLGADNYDFEPAVGDLAGAQADSFKHAKIALEPAAEPEGYAIKIIGVRELVTGNKANGLMYLNEVVSL